MKFEYEITYMIDETRVNNIVFNLYDPCAKLLTSFTF